eukprot:8292421-Pyramimonas_sp.AAC.2
MSAQPSHISRPPSTLFRAASLFGARCLRGVDHVVLRDSQLDMIGSSTRVILLSGGVIVRFVSLSVFPCAQGNRHAS